MRHHRSELVARSIHVAALVVIMRVARAVRMARAIGRVRLGVVVVVVMLPHSQWHSILRAWLVVGSTVPVFANLSSQREKELLLSLLCCT